MSLPHIITPNVITVIDGNRSLTVSSGQPNYKPVKEAIAAGDWSQVVELMDVKSLAKQWSKNGFVITEDQVTYNGRVLPEILQRRVIAAWLEGAPFTAMLNFFARLEQNPSARSIEQLYKFLEHGNMPIDDNGFFYGYKAVREDWKDCHSGKFSNHIGAVLEVPRNQVDDDPARGCSYGFHVGSLNYAVGFRPANGRLLIVRVDPAHVVSVPHDCNYQKLRTSRYEVVSEYTGPLPEGYVGYATEVDEDGWLDEVEEINDDFSGWFIDEIQDEAAAAAAEVDKLTSAREQLARELAALDDQLAEQEERLDLATEAVERRS
jgi:hypothetical protein